MFKWLMLMTALMLRPDSIYTSVNSLLSEKDKERPFLVVCEFFVYIPGLVNCNTEKSSSLERPLDSRFWLLLACSVVCPIFPMLNLVFLPTVRSIWWVYVTCTQLFLEVGNFHANMCWKFILWTVSITTFPFRALGALQREKTMGLLLQQMGSELQCLLLENKKLEARLKMVVKERQLMESMLAEIEDEHDVATGKIEHLENKVERLRESNTKGRWDSSIKSNTTTFRHKTSSTDDKQIKTRNQNVITLDQRRKVALCQSIFSALLSLMVGSIIWEAKDPSIPLVMAVFSVIGLSLKSVVHLFSTIKNKPALSAVALLSFNWFILGTLTYPSLPRVARTVSPMVISFLEPSLRRAGLGSSY